MTLNQKTLTLLGCSSSLLLTLAMGNRVQANESPLRELVFTAANAEDITSDCGCRAEGLDFDLMNSDSMGDEAIARYGCDCAGCRFMVREETSTDIAGENLRIQ